MASHSTRRPARVSGQGVTPGRSSVEDHIARLREVLEPVLLRREAETLPLMSAGLCGRVSAENVVAPAPLPGFDNSQMDGFAVHSVDLKSDGSRLSRTKTRVRSESSEAIEGMSAEGANAAPSLPLAGTVAAGSPAPLLPPGSCLAVMTGAPIPEGADLVVPVEKTAEGFSVLEALNAGESPVVRFIGLTESDCESGKFIRPAGSDMAAGETVLQAGDVLTPGRIGVLAACGIPEISVWKRIRTVVIATGEEIRTPGEELAPGQLYDANGVLIRAVCEGFGHQVRVAQIASDAPDQFASRLDELLTESTPHLLITAGGISAGAFEVVRQALAERGVAFGSVAQQPGGPQGWGVLEGAGGGGASVAVVAMPGNPVSCAVSLETLLRPALAELDSGCPPQRRVAVELGQQLSSPLGLRQFRRVELHAGPTVPVAVPIGGPSSHLIGHLSKADALLELCEDDTDVPAGTIREAILL